MLGGAVDIEWPVTCEIPELPDARGGGLGAWVLRTGIFGGFPPGKAQFLATTFVRTFDHALRRYETARTNVTEAAEKQQLVAYLRGIADMEAAVIFLNKAMRLAARLVESQETRIGKDRLPSHADRDKLRKMRNAIDHDDEPILDGRAGTGEILSLALGSTQMAIADEAGEERIVSYEQFASWLEKLHDLVWALIDDPESLSRA